MRITTVVAALLAVVILAAASTSYADIRQEILTTKGLSP